MMADPSKISGWILPRGEWVEVEEWWHISYLYELKDDPNLPGSEHFQTQQGKEVLKRGDESEIRDFAATVGFVKLSRGEIDSYGMTSKQLTTLKELIEWCDPDFEFRLLIRGGQVVKPIAVDRLLKLRSSTRLFQP